MNCQITVMDFIEQHPAIYVQVEVYDKQHQQLYQQEVRFLEDLLYGDLVHAKKSPLTESCRLQTIAYIRNYFNR